jgi:pyruvate kinase
MFKTVLTCGPACASDLLLKKMAQVADGFRLNVAHLVGDKLSEWMTRLQELRQQTGRDFSIVLDLQGAKVRIGSYPAVTELPARVELFLGESSSRSERIPVPAASVFAQTSPGDELFLNDRKVVLRVVSKGSDYLQAEVAKNGALSSGKGINSPDRVFELARITEGDLRAIRCSKDFANVAYAVSFVADGHESSLFRPLVADARLIAKIEQRQAMLNLKCIAEQFDELWLCRGDLGAEAGLKELGHLQSLFVAAIPALQRPALIAGEVLGSMVANAFPSRAEVVQLYDAMQSGFSGLVLSDETACGAQVAAVIEFLEYWLK